MNNNMSMRIKSALLVCLVCAAVLSVCIAYKDIHGSVPSVLPEQVFAALNKTEHCAYYLREKDGRVAVYPNTLSTKPLQLTDISTSLLRAADRAMLSKGIPVSDDTQLLILLEDFSS